jgi:hypothetical protein
MPRFSASPLTANLAFTGKRTDALARAIARNCGQEAGRRKDFHSGGALKSKLNDQGFRWFSFLQFCVSL